MTSGNQASAAVCHGGHGGIRADEAKRVFAMLMTMRSAQKGSGVQRTGRGAQGRARL